MTTRGARWATAKEARAPRASAPAPTRPMSRAKPRLEIICPPRPAAAAGSLAAGTPGLSLAAACGSRACKVHRLDVPRGARTQAPGQFAAPPAKKRLVRLGKYG